MPWKERTVMSEREDFVARAQQKEESFSALCREYGITRMTGYKWLERARNGELLSDRSRAPGRKPRKTLREVEDLILEARDAHPAWGPRKLRQYLCNKGYEQLPCKSTIGNILRRNDRIEPEMSASHKPMVRFEREHANDLWQMDFKGDFLMLDGRRCFPLTILDDHSRFSLCLNASGTMRNDDFRPVIRRVFEEYGLPNDILCDNGKPWGDSRPGLTGFDVWMMQLDVLPIHIRPKRPQTQGKEERFHRTLKDEVLKRRCVKDLVDAQRVFDPWRYEYNYERPHDALGLGVPGKRYRPSLRKYPAVLSEPEYDGGMRLRKVNYKGYVSLFEYRFYLSESLVGKFLSVEDVGDGVVGLFYGSYQVARVDLNERLVVSRRVYRRA